MEIEVNVEAEDIAKGTRVHTGNAYVTFVALDNNGKPTQVPTLCIENPEDQKRFDEGKLRMEKRMKQRKN
jgi:acyl-CoA hydrolase